MQDNATRDPRLFVENSEQQNVAVSANLGGLADSQCATVDTGRLRELEQALVEKEEGLKALQGQRDAISAADVEKRARWEDLGKQRVRVYGKSSQGRPELTLCFTCRAQKKAVEEQRRAVRDARTAFERARVNLDQERKKRDDIQNLPSEEEKRKKHTKTMARMARERLQGARRLTVSRSLLSSTNGRSLGQC